MVVRHQLPAPVGVAIRSALVFALVMVAAGRAPASASPPAIRFDPARTYPASPYSANSVYGSGQIASGAFTGRQPVDLVLNNCNGSGPVVLANRGDGSFAPPRLVETGTDACAVGAADLRGDGRDDIVAGSWRTNEVTVLLSNGDDTFRLAGRYRIAGAKPMAIAFADFNGDGHLDLAALSNDGWVTILVGRGDGTFVLGPALKAAHFSISFTIGDFDGDGRPDLAVSEIATRSQVQSEVVVWRNHGDATFTRLGSYPVGWSDEYLANADLDDDGHLDIVSANANSSDLSILWGRGDGSFQPEQRIRGIPLTGKPGVQIADFDGDGRLDIASTDTVLSQIEILRNLGHRRLQFAGQWAATDTNGPQMFIADDFCGHGRPDLAVAGYLPGVMHGDMSRTRMAVLCNTSPRPA